ncbi:hypothetical protein [Phormidium tenue]|uniref:Uncharacterized protein n=1 Tax=Phormidium tenue NIES-30 TaxID=549789 RepID=A0A1U7IZX2_9CYAN|nr:hypothetical protein [Phormidium tenue]MBD2234070.1 hypothetical protein [Phormidium tenue FACHB-1052]OKH44689.1 hypothetical protein NIES30_22015 [Phormidium tenue NIES-30]
MHQYVLDTEYAVRGLIDLISVEEKRLSQLQNKYHGLSSKAKYLNQQLMDAPFNDNVVSLQEQAIAIDSRRTHEELANLQKQIVAIQASIDVNCISIDALCSAVLQIAKQGISIAYTRLSQCPDGRNIGTEKLKNVIWQARNQSMHYEEGNFKQPVVDCFANLEISLGNQFSLSLNMYKNLAHDVIKELGWKDYSAYESDLKSLT